MGANYLLTASHGKRSLLDKVYYEHITCILETLDEDSEIRWETYNLIIDQIMKATNKDYLDELKYRLTDGEDPNQIILDIIERENESIDSLVWFLKRRVEEFIEEDFFKRFLP
jgi:hypothetical protein